MAPVIECVPNFSEGRRTEVIEAIVGAIGAVSGVRLLGVSPDADHNRTVVTFAGEPEAVLQAAFRGAAVATRLIDLTQHRGNHPRMGATDVIPFVPVGAGATMAQCVELAHRLGQMLADQFHIPVYLYEAAATRSDRKNLADVRRGEFEGLQTAIADPDRHPDFGPPAVHATAGATAVGARPPLIAYNVNLGTADMAVARAIAKAVRGSSGGLVGVKALPVELKDRQQVQVSMNLVNFKETPIHRAFELVRLEAERYGVPVVGSEVVGLIPLEALVGVANHYLRLEGFKAEQVLEQRLYGAE